MIRIAVVTAFPDVIRSYTASSMIGRAIDNALVRIDVIDIRDHADGAYGRIDDYAYGGGGGMVMMAEPLKRAIDSAAPSGSRWVIYPSPQGAPLHQELAEDIRRIAQEKTLVIVCGHYEGIDERFTERYVDAEFCMGDFVLTGGELPALTLIDCVSRLVGGVVGKERSVQEDSFYRNMLDYPHYTRPAEWDGIAVPDVLLQGSDSETEAYRMREASMRTMLRRPDLLSRAAVMPYLRHGVYAVQLHSNVLDRSGERSTTALTGLDVHDIARACATYGIKKYVIISPFDAQRDIAKRIAAHWTTGSGAELNPDRRDAMKLVKTFASFKRALDWIAAREHAEPFTIATTASMHDRAENWVTLKAKLLRLQRPTVFIFGTGCGLHPDVLEQSDAVLAPISGASGTYNHLSVRSAASIIFDRFFGFR